MQTGPMLNKEVLTLLVPFTKLAGSTQSSVTMESATMISYYAFPMGFCGKSVICASGDLLQNSVYDTILSRFYVL